MDSTRKDQGFYAERTPEGFLKITGRLTRVGVFEYEDEAGNSWGEYRSEEEVFAPESLESFQMVILTDDHPAEMISAANVADYQVGHVGTDVVRDGSYVIATILVTDAQVINAIANGKVELSCGYHTNVLEEPGVSPEGFPYERIQTEIRGNHLALVDQGRAGPNCKLVLDALSARSFDGVFMKKKSKKDGVMKWGETEFEVPEGFTEHFTMLQEAAAKAAASAEEVAPEGDAPMDEDPLLAAEELPLDEPLMDEDMPVEELPAEEMPGTPLPQMASKDAKAFQRVSQYVALLDSAKAVLGSSVKLDASPDVIKRAVIYKVMPSMRGSFDSASSEAIDGAYKMAVSAHRKNQDSKESFRKGAFDASSAPKTDSALEAFDSFLGKRNKKVGTR